ncbi:peptide deformylase [Paenibacillus sp. 1001270B_150601_E10]|uniref:peptide deformylase n=1 Tax=Paenibacillus sp. 1001270B_150601_E10 TaxID=2787079 RepID=UPI00189F2CF0|nr:peptide deformylase [Paenibacillus sp. 1001270B_150601_E10]
MAVREILPFGDPILRKTCRPITEMTPRMVQLLDDLKETLYDKPGRAGLAAPQIGILRRAVVMDVGEGFYEFINPEILECSGEQVGLEGCLSYPHYYGNVQRYEHVKLQYMTRELETKTLEASGYFAVCIQHELDHLDGVLFIDRMGETFLVHERTHDRVPVMEVLKLSNQNVCKL